MQKLLKGTMGRLFTIGILVAVTSMIFTLVNKKQSEPYMDEIFHIPQAQNYCHFQYDHWNEKITTLPGLYLSSQIPLSIYSLRNSKSLKDCCNVYLLRLTNIIFIVGCYFVFFRIFKILQCLVEEADNHIECNQLFMKAHTNALILTTFPLLYFYSFLYYTDVGSTFFVLLGYYYSLQDSHITSAAVGCIAVLFRQTNIIWVGFAAASSIVRYLVNKNQYDDSGNIFKDVISLIQGCFRNFKNVVNIALPYVLVLIAFIIFVVKNNGIVVGDRSMHEVSFNLPQLLYFSTFAMFFSCFLLTRYINIKKIKDIIKSITLLKILFCLLVVVVMFAAIYNFTYIHKYLISDNRHYTFYMWRKIINRCWYARYLLIPFYLVSWIIIFNELSTESNNIWMLMFFLCSFVTLVPQKLLEFRYFIIPYILFRLHIKTATYPELLIEFLVYIFVNTVTLYLFLYHPFYWPLDDSVQRFMW